MLQVNSTPFQGYLAFVSAACQQFKQYPTVVWSCLELHCSDDNWPGVDFYRHKMDIETTLQIRPAEACDAASACKVLRCSISECCIEDHRNDEAVLATWLGNKTPETVATWFSCQSNCSVVAVDDGEVVGVAILSRQGRILLFYVAPEVRFTGVGKALLREVEARAKEWGLRSLQVASTLTAKDFYLRNGFVQERVTTSPFGTQAPALSKSLDAKNSLRKTPCRCGG